MNCEALTQTIRKSITTSKKILILLLLLTSVIQNSDAKKRTWKRQIYVGTYHTKGKYLPINAVTYDLNFVSKEGWLFNGGFTHSKYFAKLAPNVSSGFSFFTKPEIFVKQINLSAGKRFDLLPKWSVSLFSGLSYTNCKYPESMKDVTFKTGGYIPISLSAIGAHYATKTSIGLRVNGELNFYLCENIMLQIGYMHDFNNAHTTGGFTFGGRAGLMKQKYGTRRISKATF